MTMNYAKNITTNNASSPIYKKKDRMVRNNAGGFVFKLDVFQQLKRFLILGTENGTYYVNQKDHTFKNTVNLEDAIKQDGAKVVDVIEEVSFSGIAPKNDACIFALAMVFTHGDINAKKRAEKAFNNVIRIGTHLFQFCDAIKRLRGFGRSVRRCISNWYVNNNNLTLQVSKYRSREKWSHKDVIRLTHVSMAGVSSEIQSTFDWICGKKDFTLEKTPEKGLELLWCVDRMNKIGNDAKSENQEKTIEEYTKDIIGYIKEYNLPWEYVPTNFLTKDVWKHILPNLKLNALIRNLGVLSKHDILNDKFNEQTKFVCDKLRNDDYIKKERLHPINVLHSLRTYGSGHGEKGSNTWDVSSKITSALEDTFIQSFKFVKPTGKNILVAIDVSGSMSGSSCNGFTNLSIKEAAAAMTMAIIRSEKPENTHVVLFSDKVYDNHGINDKTTLHEIVNISNKYSGGTNIPLVVKYALDKNIDNIDCFVILTDSETWQGTEHTDSLYNQYKNKYNKYCKMVIMGMVGTEYTVGDPKDQSVLNICGIDSSAPVIINEFIRGNI